jgi:hypothetical protein
LTTASVSWAELEQITVMELDRIVDLGFNAGFCAKNDHTKWSPISLPERSRICATSGIAAIQKDLDIQKIATFDPFHAANLFRKRE